MTNTSPKSQGQNVNLKVNSQSFVPQKLKATSSDAKLNTIKNTQANQTQLINPEMLAVNQ